MRLLCDFNLIDCARPEQESELYANLLAYQVQVRQLEDKIKQLEKEKQHYLMENNAEVSGKRSV